MHYAVDHVDTRMLFPEYSADRSIKSEELTNLLNKTNLNEAQRSVVDDILDPLTSHVGLQTILCMCRH